MKNKYVLILAFFLISSLIFGLYKYFKPSEKEITDDSELTITSAQLYKEFEENEAEANSKYLNKVVEVHGIISAITTDSVGVNVTLKTPDALSGVICQLADTTKAARLKINQKVKIKGLCTGFLMDVVLVKCLLL